MWDFRGNNSIFSHLAEVWSGLPHVCVSRRLDVVPPGNQVPRAAHGSGQLSMQGGRDHRLRCGKSAEMMGKSCGVQWDLMGFRRI